MAPLNYLDFMLLAKFAKIRCARKIKCFTVSECCTSQQQSDRFHTSRRKCWCWPNFNKLFHKRA